jgi:hypothetical protein
MARHPRPGHTAGIESVHGERHEAHVPPVPVFRCRRRVRHRDRRTARQRRPGAPRAQPRGSDGQARPEHVGHVPLRADASRGEHKTLGGETKKAADATKRFGHHTADKLREIGAKTDAKFDHKSSAAKSPYQHGPQ